MKEVRLDIFKFRAATKINAIDLYAIEQREWRDLIRTLVVSITGERQDPYIVKQPATWWQHFKADYFPRWALRRWPVVMTKTELSVATLYPHLKTELPAGSWGPQVFVMVQNKIISDFLTDTPGLIAPQWREEVRSILFQQHWTDAEKCPTCRRAFYEYRMR